MSDWDDLPHEVQLKIIRAAFDNLCIDGRVPYGVQTGDDDVWDTYAPAVELAQSWYEDDPEQWHANSNH